jgi:hypothetical protein
MQPWRSTQARLRSLSQRSHSQRPRQSGSVAYTDSKENKRRRSQQPFVRERYRPVPNPNYQPFQIPEVVLDLDSYDSKDVRVYTEKDEESQRRIWKSNTPDVITNKVAGFEKELRRSDQCLESIQTDSLNVWQVSRFDILATAINGYRCEESHPTDNGGHTKLGFDVFEGNSRNFTNSSIKNVISMNGIPTRIRLDDKTLLQWALHRQRAAAGPPRDAMSFTAGLKDLQTFTEIRRLVSSTIQTETGAKLAAQRADDIATCCIRLAKQQKVGLGTMLPFLNSLQLRLLDKDLQLGQSLCGLALMSSAAAFQLQATLKFFRIGLENGYWGPKATGNVSASVQIALELLLHALKSPSRELAALPNGPNTIEGRLGLFCLLTGRSLDAPHGKQSSGLRATVTQNPDTHGIYFYYIHVLAELGAHRTLVAELLQSSATSRSINDSANHRKFLGFTIRELFVSALRHSSGSVTRFKWTRSDGDAIGQMDKAEAEAADLETISQQSVPERTITADAPTEAQTGALPASYFEVSQLDIALAKELEQLLTKEGIINQDRVAELQALLAKMDPPSG